MNNIPKSGHNVWNSWSELYSNFIGICSRQDFTNTRWKIHCLQNDISHQTIALIKLWNSLLILSFIGSNNTFKIVVIQLHVIFRLQAISLTLLDVKYKLMLSNLFPFLGITSFQRSLPPFGLVALGFFFRSTLDFFLPFLIWTLESSIFR